MKFHSFETLTELIEFLLGSCLNQIEALYYQAPMELEPRYVVIRKLELNFQTKVKSMITVWTPATKTLRLNLAEHLDRFRCRARQ